MKKAISTGPADPVQRACGYTHNGADARCGAPAAYHVAWELRENNASRFSFVCEDDGPVIMTEFDFAGIHPIGDNCGLPDMWWRVPGSGLSSYCGPLPPTDKGN